MPDGETYPLGPGARAAKTLELLEHARGLAAYVMETYVAELEQYIAPATAQEAIEEWGVAVYDGPWSLRV